MPQDKEYLLKEQTAEATYQKKLTAGANITISTNNVISAVNTPATTVSITPTISIGTKIADFEIDGVSGELYAPSGGGGGGSSDIEVPIIGQWEFWNESGMSLSQVNNQIKSQWLSGSAIGAVSTIRIKIPKKAKAIKYKYTTSGESYYTDHQQDIYRVTFNLFSNYQPNQIPSGTSLFTQYVGGYNDVTEEGILDISSVDSDSYLYVYTSGWTLQFEYIEYVVDDDGGSDVSITPTFVDGVKIADYEIDGVSGILKIPVKELTQTEYDALPNTKLTDNVVYYISGTKVLDPDYEYHEYIDSQNGKIVVRIHGNVTEWFFMEWHQTTTAMSFPTELEPYKPSNTEPILGANYPDGGTTQDGWIGFYDNSIRAWSQSTEYNVTGIEYGVVNINGESRQYIPYEDPYVWISSSIKKIVVNGTEYGNTGGGGSGTEIIPNPQDQPTDTLESIGIDGIVYELPGADKSIPLFKEGQWLNQDIIEITPYLATIENNKLHCQGLHCGIVVSNIISLSDAVYYSITIKVSSTNGFGFQIGQCVPTTNLDGIIGSGTDRITYNNESSFDSGELTITTNNNTNGIFLGGYYQDVNTDYYIEEISLLKITVVKKEYT